MAKKIGIETAVCRMILDGELEFSNISIVVGRTPVRIKDAELRDDTLVLQCEKLRNEAQPEE